MSAFRRLSFVGGSSDDTEEDQRQSPHRHPHLHRRKKDYSFSPTGGNRPVSITADPRLPAPPPPLSEISTSSRLGRSHTSKPDLGVEVRRHKSRSDKESSSSSSRKHRSRTEDTSRAVGEKESRRHKSRSELSSTTLARESSSRHSNSHSNSSRSDSPRRKHSSKSRKHRSERSETAPVELRAAVPSAPSAPIAMPMHGQISEPLEMPEPFQTSQQFPLPDSLHIIDMSKTLSNSPPSSGSSMGIIIGGNRNRSGSTPSTPMITATPPTPSPFEQARRSNTHPSFSTPALPGFSRTGSIPPPYPQTPPTSGGEMSGQDYIDYAVSKIGIGKPDQNSLLHRYRTNFDPRPGTFELSSEPEPIEIGSSDHGTIEQPQRQDSGKSFSSSGNVNINANGNGSQHQRGHSSGHGSGHGEIHVKIKRHSATSGTLSRRALGRSSMRENQYDFLRSFDTVFIIDDSASMEAFTRWSDTRIALETIATIATKYDTDGIDIHFLNSTKHDARNVKSAAEVHRLFDRVQPGGITPIATCLDRILRDYLDSYAAVRTSSPGSPPMTPLSPGFNTAQYPKPLNIIILTDGEPTDDPESVIVDAARRLDMLNAPLHQVGIQFFQIGDEEGAREALEDLDDALAEIYGIRDMVDYTPYPDGQKEGEGREGGGVDGEWILKVLMGAVNRRLDRWENKHGR